MHGEQKDADFTVTKNWINNKCPMISSEYPPCNVYNLDEIRFHYHVVSIHVFENKDAKGCTTSKECLTTL